MAHEVTFIPGDGTGPELTEATRRVPSPGMKVTSCAIVAARR